MDNESLEIPSSGAPEKKPSEDNVYLIPGSILVAGVIIAGAVIYAFSPAQPPSYGGNTTPPPGAITLEELAGDDPFLGSIKAPVTIVEFADFQCPYCKQFFDTSRKDIIEKYVNTGKARLVYRDFPLENIHPSARPAAEAAECANEQGKFWEYHDALYLRHATLPTMNYVGLAEELGLKKTQFESCVQSRKYKDEVTQDYNDGIRAGVDGTPAVFVNGKMLKGAQPFSVFQAEIDAALSK